MMKIRTLLSLTLLALLAVSFSAYAAQGGAADQQIAVDPAQEAVASLAGETSTDCRSASTLQEQPVVATPLDGILADDCDSYCDTQEECEISCESTLAHCQLAINCCICF
jgi:hypothetical protein